LLVIKCNIFPVIFRKFIDKIGLSHSVDFSQIFQTNYAYQSKIADQQSKIFFASSSIPSLISRLSPQFGLRILESDYQNYFVNFPCKIDKGGISVWFYKISLASKTLFSGWDSTTGTIFSINVGNSVFLNLPNGNSIFDTNLPNSIISINSWNHILILWQVIGSSISSIFLLNNLQIGELSINSGVTTPILATSKIFLGASANNANNLISSTIFDGYIRRTDLISTDLNQQLSEIKPYLPLLGEQFITNNFNNTNTTTICTKKYNNCSFCDTFSLECFPNLLSNEIPENDDDLCVSHINNECIQCKENALRYDKYDNLLPKCECKIGYININGFCELCNSFCRTCILPNDNTKCTSCYGDNVLVPTDYSSYILSGKCETKCPDIKNLAVLNNICDHECPSQCYRCTENNDTKCTFCNPGYLLYEYNNSTNGECLKNCPIGTANPISGQKCLKCHEDCTSCFEPNNSSACFNCNPNKPFLNELANSTMGYCTQECLPNTNDTLFYTDLVHFKCYNASLQKCPIDTYQNDTNFTCQKCHDSCFGCAKPNDTNKCLGCINATEFLILENENSKGGYCGAVNLYENLYECNRTIRVCIKNIETKINKESAENITNNISWSLISAIWIFVVLAVFFAGSLQKLVAVFGIIQLQLLISVIQLEKNPVKLLIFYTKLGFISFEFIPNFINIFNVRLIQFSVTQNLKYHPSIFITFYELN